MKHTILTCTWASLVLFAIAATFVIDLLLSACTVSDTYVNRSAPTETNASSSDYSGIWITTRHVVDNDAFINVYKLENNGTGSLVFMTLHNHKSGIGEYTVTWKQIRPGEITLHQKKLRGSFWNTPTNYSCDARMTSTGLETSSRGGLFSEVSVYNQYYRPDDPELSNMVAKMQRETNGSGDNALGQILGQVASAALSSGVNTLANNPQASMSEVRYEAAKGALESLQQ